MHQWPEIPYREVGVVYAQVGVARLCPTAVRFWLSQRGGAGERATILSPRVRRGPARLRFVRLLFGIRSKFGLLRSLCVLLKQGFLRTNHGYSVSRHLGQPAGQATALTPRAIPETDRVKKDYRGLGRPIVNVES